MTGLFAVRYRLPRSEYHSRDPEPAT